MCRAILGSWATPRRRRPGRTRARAFEPRVNLTRPCCAPPTGHLAARGHVIVLDLRRCVRAPSTPHGGRRPPAGPAITFSRCSPPSAPAPSTGSAPLLLKHYPTRRRLHLLSPGTSASPRASSRHSCNYHCARLAERPRTAFNPPRHYCLGAAPTLHRDDAQRGARSRRPSGPAAKTRRGVCRAAARRDPRSARATLGTPALLSPTPLSSRRPLYRHNARRKLPRATAAPLYITPRLALLLAACRRVKYGRPPPSPRSKRKSSQPARPPNSTPHTTACSSFRSERGALPASHAARTQTSRARRSQTGVLVFQARSGPQRPRRFAPVFAEQCASRRTARRAESRLIQNAKDSANFRGRAGDNGAPTVPRLSREETTRRSRLLLFVRRAGGEASVVDEFCGFEAKPSSPPTRSPSAPPPRRYAPATDHASVSCQHPDNARPIFRTRPPRRPRDERRVLRTRRLFASKFPSPLLRRPDRHLGTLWAPARGAFHARVATNTRAMPHALGRRHPRRSPRPLHATKAPMSHAVERSPVRPRRDWTARTIECCDVRRVSVADGI